MIRLSITCDGATAEREFPQDSVSLGRAEDNVLPLADKKASRHHAVLAKKDGRYRLANVDSRNGMLLNGKRVEDAPVAVGDEFVIGDTRMRILTLDDLTIRPPDPVDTPRQEPAPALSGPPPDVSRKDAALETLESARRTYDLARKGVVVAVVALVAVLILSNLPKDAAKAPAAAAPAPRGTPLKEAEAALASFNARADAASQVNDALLAEATALAAKYNALYDSGSPFDHLLQSLTQRRAEEQARRFDGMKSRIEIALKDRRYGEAVEALRVLQAEPDSGAPSLAAQVAADIRLDFEGVDGFGRNLEALRLFDDATEHYRRQAPRFAGTAHHPYLASRPDALARAAAEAAKPPEPPPIAAVAAPESAPEKPAAASPLLRKLIDAIKVGKIPGRNFATETELTVGQEKVPWSSIAPEEMLKLYSSIGLPDEDLPALAAWAWSAGLKADAARLLARTLGGVTPGARKAETDALVAKWRGVAVPEGGYSWDVKYGWEDRNDRLNREAAMRVPNLCKTLASSADPRTMEKVFQDILGYYGDAALRPTLKESIRMEALTALRSNKEKRLKAIESKAKASGGFAQLRQLKLELNRRRDAALKLIYDGKIYLPENHPDWRKGDDVNGQTAVDKLVLKEHKGGVGELWESAGSVVATLDPSIRKDVDLINELNSKYLAELGKKPTEDDLKGYEEILLNLNARIDLKSFCLDEKEREVWLWNRRVDKYNEAVADPGIGAEEKAHAKVVNDYREMMGRKRLFLDARLCRATKKHSEAQNAAQKIWHVGSDGDPQSRARNEGFPAGVGENVAIGYGHPADVWTRGWYRASDHHRNGLSDAWTCLGYGYAGNVGSQNFSNIPVPTSFPAR